MEYIVNIWLKKCNFIDIYFELTAYKYLNLLSKNMINWVREIEPKLCIILDNIILKNLF